MAFLDDLTKSASSPAGLAAGVGTVLLTPLLAPAVSRVLYPGAKALLSAGITAYRSAAEPISAAIGQLVTEAQMELATAKAGTVPAAVTVSAAPEPAPAAPKARRHKHRDEEQPDDVT